MTEEKFYTVDEVAQILKVNPMTVYRWIKAGKLPSYKVEKQYRINKLEFDKFLEKNKYRKTI